ncbi:hypothetical protein P170DRAFT_438701 [Aspergillus steynii IBT 23096]|uniref:HCNGP-domain-containing protein n=1 Tax=Aspergillus steynii IBT 23096 TaxID=1392250 RepID=A0A2I2G284_9EURO|nr:uncharacterized protein P170DRAFT_438701 [Aspergillus steynii IBT 23096]PLB46988.1 hypothetical protein P170DRAFT_438701 [Aspergillus steynii IBT 23096]
MLGLAAYDSSSDDEVDTRRTPLPKRDLEHGSSANPNPTEDNAQSTPDTELAPVITADPNPRGPVLGPSHQEVQPSNTRSLDGQSSPYSASRNLVHDLTLPPVPSLDIPLSPPGSPSPTANAKFAHFLALKKQEVHFNEKLASSTSLKNPSLLKKLMDHAGLSEEMQYHTALPRDLWDMASLPSWGFKEELLKAQKEIHSNLEERKLPGKRETIDFVSATAPGVKKISKPNP